MQTMNLLLALRLVVFWEAAWQAPQVHCWPAGPRTDPALWLARIHNSPCLQKPSLKAPSRAYRLVVLHPSHQLPNAVGGIVPQNGRKQCVCNIGLPTGCGRVRSGHELSHSPMQQEQAKVGRRGKLAPPVRIDLPALICTGGSVVAQWSWRSRLPLRRVAFLGTRQLQHLHTAVHTQTLPLPPALWHASMELSSGRKRVYGTGFLVILKFSPVASRAYFHIVMECWVPTCWTASHVEPGIQGASLVPPTCSTGAVRL